MTNTLITPSLVAREALMQLRNNTVMARLVHRDYEKEFVSGAGATVTVRKPATFEAKEFTSTIDVQNATEDDLAVTLNKHLDVSFAVTAQDLTLNIQDFSRQFLQPAMLPFAQKIDEYLVALYKDIPYYVGAAGTTPDGLDDFANSRKRLNQLKAPMGDRSLVIDPEAEAKFLVLDAIVGADKSGDNGTALREASLGRVMGFNTYSDQNIAKHTKGTLTGTTQIEVKGAVAAGATTCTLDDTSGMTGTLVVGDIFTVENVVDAWGNPVPFTVVTGGTAAANELAVTFYPAAPTGGFADNANVTIVGTHRANLAFHRNAFALVTRPLALPQGVGSGQAYYETFDGFTIRVVQSYDVNAKKDIISLDMILGVKTLYPELAVRLLG